MAVEGTMPTQWHNAFAFLLRPIVEQYFEISTNVPVGELPREADVVLVHRKERGFSLLDGIWRRLTAWNILEYKGPTVSPRSGDIDLLAELGLGIHRRLNEENKKNKKTLAPASEVSFWFLAHHLGRGFYDILVRRGLGRVEILEPGVWQCWMLKHPMFLVSSSKLPVAPGNLPLHMLGIGSEAKKSEVMRVLNENRELKQRYNEMWASLHPEQLQEFIEMARTSKKGVTFHLMPLVELIGWKETIHQLGSDRLIDELFADDAKRKRALNRLVGHLSATEKRELIEQLARKKEQ
jgi:hypothetical protein